MNHVKLATIKKIAKSKGLVFDYDEEEDVYFVTDRHGMLLMEYAPITIMLIKNANVWRHEFNVLNRHL